MKNKSGLLTAVVLLLLGGHVSVLAAKAASFRELIKPESILVDGGQAYITQCTSVFVYSMEDGCLLKTFGREGEGPQEFMRSRAPWMPSLYLFLKPDQLLINSTGKISLYSRCGEFIKEMKNPAQLRVFMPFGEKYIGFGFGQEGKDTYFVYYLYDAGFNKEKELIRMDSPEQQGKKIDPITMGMIKQILYRYGGGGRFVLPDFDGVAHVFDTGGSEVATITPPYRKEMLTTQLSRKFDQLFKLDPRFKMIYSMQKDRIQFPGHLPLMKDYRVAENKLYMVSSKKVGDAYETFVYNLDGKLLEKIYLPLKDRDLLEVYPFAIADGKLYQLVENEDEEEWELHVNEIH